MPTAPQLPQLFTVDQFCKQTGIGRANVYKMIRQGRLPAVHIGRAVRISAAAAQAWIEQGGSPEAGEAA